MVGINYNIDEVIGVKETYSVGFDIIRPNTGLNKSVAFTVSEIIGGLDQLCEFGIGFSMVLLLKGVLCDSGSNHVTHLPPADCLHCQNG